MSNLQYPPEVIEYMMTQMGGKDTVMKGFYRARIAEMARDGKTLACLLDVAEEEGFAEWLRAAPLRRLAELIAGVTDDDAAPAAETGRKRLTAAEKEKLHEDVQKHLEAHPWTKSGDVAEAIGFPAKKIGAHLRELKSAKVLKSHGEKGATVYALTGEKSKPQ